MLKVELLAYTPEPEKLIASAARLCYSSCSIERTREKLTDEKVSSFVDMLAGMGHESPLEHISFTFGIEGVSRALLAQLTRHRIASYSVQSQRYVKENQFDYIVPPEVEESEEAKNEFISAMNKAQESYNKITSILQSSYKNEYISHGMDEVQAGRLAEKRAIEDARFVLPNACETKIICTFNARSLLNFFSQRCCNRAQWEIRELSKEMLRIVSQIAPSVFKNAGPSCVRDVCREGKMSCRKAAQVKKEFAELKGRLQ